MTLSIRGYYTFNNPPLVFGRSAREESGGAQNYNVIGGFFGPPQAEIVGHFLGVFKGETL